MEATDAKACTEAMLIAKKLEVCIASVQKMLRAPGAHLVDSSALTERLALLTQAHANASDFCGRYSQGIRVRETAELTGAHQWREAARSIAHGNDSRNAKAACDRCPHDQLFGGEHSSLAPRISWWPQLGVNHTRVRDSVATGGHALRGDRVGKNPSR